MTPQELIDGTRERGFTVMRMQEGPVTIIPRLDAVDPLCEFYGSTLGCKLVEYKPEQWTKPHKRSYEVRLHTAMVEFDLPEGAALRDLPALRAMAIWEAAAVAAS